MGSSQVGRPRRRVIIDARVLASYGVEEAPLKLAKTVTKESGVCRYEQRITTRGPRGSQPLMVGASAPGWAVTRQRTGATFPLTTRR